MLADRHYFETHPAGRRSRMARNFGPGIDRSKDLARNIPQLVADVQRDIAIIEDSIANEEAVTRQSDRSRVDYSLVARSLIARRDNLLATKTALLARMPADDVQPNSAIA